MIWALVFSLVFTAYLYFNLSGKYIQNMLKMGMESNHRRIRESNTFAAMLVIFMPFFNLLMIVGIIGGIVQGEVLINESFPYLIGFILSSVLYVISVKKHNYITIRNNNVSKNGGQ